MVNKDTTFGTFQNSVITPELVQQGINNLPRDYVKQTITVMKEAVDAGIFPKVYSKPHIIDVRKDIVFNKDILNVLVFVGLKNKLMEESYGRKKSSVTAN